MKPFPKIHDLYIGKVVLASVLLTWLVLIGMDFMVGGMLGEMDQVGTGSYRVGDAFVVVLYTLPWRAYNLFPTAAVIGSLMGLGQLAATSELTVMRAVGLSRRRLGVAVALALALLTAVMVVDGETAAPWGQLQSDNYRSAKKYNNQVLGQYKGLWAREGNTFISASTGETHAEGGRKWLQLDNMRLYDFEADGRLKSIAYAKHAEHRDGAWLLRDVTRITFADKSVQRAHADQETWASQLDDAALANSLARPGVLDSRALKESIDYRKRNGLDSTDFEERYWSHFFYPLNVLALCLAAVPFAFGTLRSGGLGKRLFLGIVFALGFWMLQTQSVRLASVFKIDYRVAFMVPLLVMMSLSWVLFNRKSN